MTAETIAERAPTLEKIVMREYTQLGGNLMVRLSAVFANDVFQHYQVEHTAINGLGCRTKTEEFAQGLLDTAINAFRKHVTDIF